MDMLCSGGIRVAHMLHPLDVNEIRMIAVEKLLLQNRLMRSHETSQPNKLVLPRLLLLLLRLLYDI